MSDSVEQSIIRVVSRGGLGAVINGYIFPAASLPISSPGCGKPIPSDRSVK